MKLSTVQIQNELDMYLYNTTNKQEANRSWRSPVNISP